ncbi:proteasome assembly chaperone 2-like [Sinocyclocheilus rhinocerous]|uniref:Proteasome assembly chaperone 2 n=1 Tax=Sinocyclocheilus rhinocerous TaxID=307959 RepID=A0A673MEB7_9TELE|nr:PREDICTED: proteasome assembly chaperone 2-like [Sinocyclocheilus rhinocerous]
MFIASGDGVPSFKGFTLIMPAVSAGNVGQLAVDLLISTLNMPRVGYFHTDCLTAMAGNSPYSASAQLSTGAEVYSHRDLKLAVLQIRTPIIQTKVRSFRKLMVSWIKSSGFLRSVLLSSSHAYHRDDQQLHGTPLRYLLTPSLQKEEAPRVEELGWREMERISAFPGISDSEQRLYIPGGGVTKALYTDCCTEDISMAVMLIFCSEGDNIPDAFALVNHLNDWLHLLEKPTQGSVQWRVPPSWRLLFGSGIPPLLF